MVTRDCCWGKSGHPIRKANVASNAGCKYSSQAGIDKTQCTLHVTARGPVASALQEQAGHSGLRTFETGSAHTPL